MDIKGLIKSAAAAAMSFTVAACGDKEATPQKHVTVDPNGHYVLSENGGKSYKQLEEGSVRESFTGKSAKVNGHSGFLPLITDNSKVLSADKVAVPGPSHGPKNSL